MKLSYLSLIQIANENIFNIYVTILLKQMQFLVSNLNSLFSVSLNHAFNHIVLNMVTHMAGEKLNV